MTGSPANRIRAHVWVRGRVQGVSYRAFARGHAVRKGLSGGVRNLEDGRVEVDVEGDKQAVETFIELLRAGPPLARIEGLEIRWESPASRYVGFHIWY